SGPIGPIAQLETEILVEFLGRVIADVYGKGFAGLARREAERAAGGGVVVIWPAARCWVVRSRQIFTGIIYRDGFSRSRRQLNRDRLNAVRFTDRVGARAKPHGRRVIVVVNRQRCRGRG